MSSLLHRLETEVNAKIVDVKADEERISIFLDDERLISFPVNWSPRSEHGTVEERNNWELLGSGMGIHWPDLDEDLSLAGILLGLRSGESERSFKRWLKSRQKSKDLIS